MSSTRPTHPRGFDARASGETFYDPALQHYPSGLTRADPRLLDPADAEHWEQARDAAMYAVVAALAASPLRDRLVLRGGLAMRLWLGERARTPRDVDWVVVPATVAATSTDARALLRDVVRIAARASDHRARFVLRTPEATVDEIWTYARAEGRRVVIPFDVAPRAAPLPKGLLQMDFVFQEPLHEPSERTPFVWRDAPRGYRDDGAPATLEVASRVESLAWKLMWICLDIHPQGKDLYDAVLLAELLGEHGCAAAETLARGLLELEGHRGLAEALRDVEEHRLPVGWPHFATEYPLLAREHSCATLLARLRTALGIPT